MNIVITGGSRGIGREAALYLAEDSSNRILITGRDEKSLQSVKSSARHGNIYSYAIDLTQLGEGLLLFRDHLSKLFGEIDILVNNSGSLVNRGFNDLEEAEVREMMEVNYFAPVALIKSLFPLFRKGSHIVNISSMGGFQGSVKFKGLSCYSASKAALACLTECLAGEYAEYEIKVNCLALGSADTEMLAKAFPGYRSPVSAKDMGKYVAWFSKEGSNLFNGKIIPVALSTP